MGGKDCNETLWEKGWSQGNGSWEGVKFRMWCMRNLESFWSQVLEIFSSSNKNLLKLEHLDPQAAVLCSSHFLCTLPLDHDPRNG